MRDGSVWRYSLRTGRLVTIPTLSLRIVSTKALRLASRLAVGEFVRIGWRRAMKEWDLSPCEAEEVSIEVSWERTSGDAMIVGFFFLPGCFYDGL